ncbi:MAG: hypothetical protein NT049_01325, partial [Planctomycetota bacterium]|nr:hypothetical protein [Planctomycetota bacterium]
ELSAAKVAGGTGATVATVANLIPTPVKVIAAAPSQTTPASPAASPAANRAYMVIPIKGHIGENFPSSAKTYLDRATKLNVTVIVLDIDTPGGLVVEAEQTVDLMIQNKNFRFVALVRSALSAGAMLALACNEIYMTDTATIGAAVSYRRDADGSIVRLPPDVDEKFQSAWRAVCRKAADHGGHDSLLAEAMADRSFALTMRKAGDRIVLERDGTGDVLKANGKILTLTAREAVACGLAKGIAEDISAVLWRLGIDQSTPASEQLVADIEGRIAALRPKVGLRRSKIMELERAKVDQRMVPPPSGGIRIVNNEERIYNFEYKDIGPAIKRGDFRTQQEKDEAIRKAKEDALPVEQELKALQDELAATKAKLAKLRTGPGI